jgi:hypothetical protein
MVLPPTSDRFPLKVSVPAPPTPGLMAVLPPPSVTAPAIVPLPASVCPNGIVNPVVEDIQRGIGGHGNRRAAQRAGA